MHHGHRLAMARCSRQCHTMEVVAEQAFSSSTIAELSVWRLCVAAPHRRVMLCLC